MSRPFKKPALSYRQQIEHLQAAGMEIADLEVARHWLCHVSYYRLSAYWLRFENGKEFEGPRFKHGTTFDAVLDLYEFDRKLRLLLLNAIERIEVAIRGSWAYALASRYGSHGYLDAALYSDRKQFHDNLARLARDAGTSPETYIEHYRKTYDDPAMPAVWMVAEMMSLGQLSRWYSSLKERALRNQIAKPLGLPEVVLIPFVKHLSTVRNSCAHHGRLWNRGFLIRMKLPEKPPRLNASLVEKAEHEPAYLYNTLAIVEHLLWKVDPYSNWRGDMIALLRQRPKDQLVSMGFPDDWLERPIWADLIEPGLSSDQIQSN